MTQELWNDVDAYFAPRLHGEDTILEEALLSSRSAGLPPIQVSAAQGGLLGIFVRMIAARRVLEVGTLGGYSTIWMARELPADGHLISLELEERHAEVARANLDRAGLTGAVEVRLGRAIDSIAAIEQEHGEPFDLVFIDADKPSNPDYFAAAMRLTHPGSVIVVDNVVRNGLVADLDSTDEAVIGVHRLADAMAEEVRSGRILATAIQTVGSKSYDGFAIAFVR
jgi:predicted O-methyltransferase YrrM